VVEVVLFGVEEVEVVEIGVVEIGVVEVEVVDVEVCVELSISVVVEVLDDELLVASLGVVLLKDIEVEFSSKVAELNTVVKSAAVVKSSVVSAGSEPVTGTGSAKIPAVVDSCVSTSADAGPSEVAGSGFTVLKNPFSCYVVTLSWKVKFAFL
jgi:hypothetical protein